MKMYLAVEMVLEIEVVKVDRVDADGGVGGGVCDDDEEN